MMRPIYVLAVFVLALAIPVSVQAQTEIHEVLHHRYGKTVEWIVVDDVIVVWKPVVVKGRVTAAIPQPTAEQIAAWRMDGTIGAAVKADVKAAAVDPHWRAVIAAMCVMTECEDESAAWAAFIAALP